MSKNYPLTYLCLLHIVWIVLKMSYLIFFLFWHFPPIFVLLKLTCLLTLFDRKLQIFKNSPKFTIFGLFNELLSTQNVNVARFARNVEWDFFCDFQTPLICLLWKDTVILVWCTSVWYKLIGDFFAYVPCTVVHVFFKT